MTYQVASRQPIILITSLFVSENIPDLEYSKTILQILVPRNILE